MLIEKYKNIRDYTVKICKPLEIEDYIPQTAPFASPPKWHLAHTTWFFEEMILKKNEPNYQEFHTEFSFLFNSYYNTIGKRVLRADRGNMTRPTVKEVYQYRKYVDEAMIQLLNKGVSKDTTELIILGLNHEQQHQELYLGHWEIV